MSRYGRTPHYIPVNVWTLRHPSVANTPIPDVFAPIPAYPPVSKEEYLKRKAIQVTQSKLEVSIKDDEL